MKKAATYVRERGGEGPYESKFADLVQLCHEAKHSGADVVLVAQPWVLGDNYEEIVESLSRIAKAGLTLAIARP